MLSTRQFKPRLIDYLICSDKMVFGKHCNQKDIHLKSWQNQMICNCTLRTHNRSKQSLCYIKNLLMTEKIKLNHLLFLF